MYNLITAIQQITCIFRTKFPRYNSLFGIHESDSFMVKNIEYYYLINW